MPRYGSRPGGSPVGAGPVHGRRPGNPDRQDRRPGVHERQTLPHRKLRRHLRAETDPACDRGQRAADPGAGRFAAADRLRNGRGRQDHLRQPQGPRGAAIHAGGPGKGRQRPRYLHPRGPGTHPEKHHPDPEGRDPARRRVHGKAQGRAHLSRDHQCRPDQQGRKGRRHPGHRRRHLRHQAHGNSPPGIRGDVPGPLRGFRHGHGDHRGRHHDRAGEHGVRKIHRASAAPDRGEAKLDRVHASRRTVKTHDVSRHEAARIPIRFPVATSSRCGTARAASGMFC